MSNELGSMVVKLGLESSGLAGGLRTASSALSGFAGSAPGLLGGVGLAVGAAAALTVGLGIATTKMAGDFQQSVTKLYTTAGESKSNLQMVGDGILGMSASVGTGAQQLVDAMYWVEGGGLHGAQGLEALRVAAQAAKAENANLDQVSIALAASLKAYAEHGMTAVQAMNTLTAATGQGMMSFEQLSGSLKNVLPASATFGISLKDVTGALATMTAQGDDAASAATHLRQMIMAFEAPASAGAKAMKAVGLSSRQLADEMRVSLPGAVQMVTDAVGKKFPIGSDKYNQAIKAIAGGSKQMMGFLELSGKHMKDFANNVGIIGSAVKKGGNDLMGWSDIQGNFNFKLDAAKAALEAAGIAIGTKLLPVMGQLLTVLTPAITAVGQLVVGTGPLATFFGAIGSSVGSVVVPAFHTLWPVLQAIGAFLVTTFKPVWQQLVSTFQTQLKPAWNDLVKAIQPIMPQLQAVAGIVGVVLVAALVLVVGVIGGVVKGLAGFLSGVIVVFGGIVKIISGALQVVGGVIAFFADVFTLRWDKLGTDIMTIVGGWGRIFSGIWDVIRGVFMAGIGAVVGFVTGFWTTIVGIFTKLQDTLVGHSIIPDIVNAIVKWFLDMGPRALGAVNTMVGLVIGAAHHLAGQMFSIGANIVNGMINGITSMFGAVGNTMSNLVATIGSYLPHSPAKQGELSHLGEYGPSFVKGLAGGIENSIPTLSATMTHLVRPMASSMPAIMPRMSYAPAPVQGSSGNASHGQAHTTIIELDGAELARLVQAHTDRQVRVKFGPRGRVA